MFVCFVGRFRTQVCGNDKVVLEQDPLYEMPKPTHSLPDWYIISRSSVQSSEKAVSKIKTYSNLRFTVKLRRRSGFYVYKVLMINVIMTVWSWCVFWLPPEDISARMDISLTLFLASVAFLFVVSDKLPKVDFLTSLDKIILFSFGLLFLSALESFVAFVSPSDTANDIDWYCRFVFPAVFVFVGSSLVMIAVKHSRASSFH